MQSRRGPVEWEAPAAPKLKKGKAAKKVRGRPQAWWQRIVSERRQSGAWGRKGGVFS